MMRLFLAPHHDDVLLSLAGYLLANKSSVEKHVVVVFSDENRELEGTCSRLHRTLGLGLHFLGFEEALKRGVSLRDCFRTTRTHQQFKKHALVELIQARLRGIVSLLQPSIIYSPMLPIHIDHALVRAAADGLHETTLLYYEDQPYACLYPRVLAQVSSGMRCLEELCCARQMAIETLFQELRGVVPTKHLNRILAHYKTSAPQPPCVIWQKKS